MMLNNDRWELVGITSYGMKCGSRTFPGIYTRVSVYIPWILCVMDGKNICQNKTPRDDGMFSYTSSSPLMICNRFIFLFSGPLIFYILLLK